MVDDVGLGAVVNQTRHDGHVVVGGRHHQRGGPVLCWNERETEGEAEEKRERIKGRSEVDNKHPPHGVARTKFLLSTLAPCFTSQSTAGRCPARAAAINAECPS